MKLVILLALLAASFVDDTFQAPVHSQREAKGKGKQIEKSLKPKTPYYKPPPRHEAYKMSIWELMEHRPEKPNKTFDKLFAGHPQMQALDPHQMEPLQLAKEVEKLRETEDGPHKAFTASIKRYLDNKEASQPAMTTVLGYNKQMRTRVQSKNAYAKVLANDDPEKAAQRRQRDSARKRAKAQEDPLPTLAMLAASKGLPDILSVPDLIKHSGKLLEPFTNRQGGLMLKEYMKTRNYKEEEKEEVMARRVRQFTVAMYAKTKDAPGEKGSTSTPNAVTHSAHQSIAQLPSSDTVGGLEQGEWWHGQYR